MTSCYDVLGIGFGPANLALAIAMQESQTDHSVRFLEAQTRPVWQGGMMLDRSNIQNHPCRDLVSLRNPRSRYSFLNYLFENDRLLEHLNLPHGHPPLRKEYADYIGWVARHFAHLVDHGVRATGIAVETVDGAPAYAVTTTTGTYHARALVLAPGRTPYVPAPYDSVASPRLFHLTQYLYRVAELTTIPRHVAVIGGSQSAVELVLDAAKRFPDAKVSLYTRSHTLRQKDASPFSEEGYFPAFTDYYHQASRSSKRVLDAYMRPTNYSASDPDVLDELYTLIYEQRLDRDQRVFVVGNRDADRVRAHTDGVTLHMREVHTGETEAVEADLVVMATGFRDLGPGLAQEPYPALMSTVADRFRIDDDGYLAIDAEYRVVAAEPHTPPLFLNGLCESSHGIGDAGSFSLLSLRAATLCTALAKDTVAQP